MHRAISVQARNNYKIVVEFEDGKVILYDLQPLFELLPMYRLLQEDQELYESVQIGAGGDLIIWNDSISLDAKTVWAKGTLIDFTKRPDVNRLLAYRMQVSRFLAGMTQKDLAEKTGLYQADISKLERGIGNPSINTLERIAEGLGMELFIDFRYPAENVSDEKGEKEMGRLAERKNYAYMIKPGMTEAFVQHLIEHKKPADYWEECAKSRDLPEEVVVDMLRLVRGDDTCDK